MPSTRPATRGSCISAPLGPSVTMTRCLQSAIWKATSQLVGFRKPINIPSPATQPQSLCLACAGQSSCAMAIHALKRCMPHMDSMHVLKHAGRIHEYYSNTYTYFTKGMNASLDKPVDWLEEQDRWARSQVAFAISCSDCCLLRSWHLSPVGTAYVPACLLEGGSTRRKGPYRPAQASS